MKIAKDIMLMSIGAAAVIAYQKYSKPMMKEIDKMMKQKMKEMNNALENMM